MEQGRIPVQTMLAIGILTTKTRMSLNHENQLQTAIAYQESNGIDIIVAIVLNDINPLAKRRMSLVLQLKNDAAKLLLSIMESRQVCHSPITITIVTLSRPYQMVKLYYNASETNKVMKN